MPVPVRSPGTPPRAWKMHLKTGKSPVSRQRPDTATLEKPLILEPQLLRKLDMTRLTRDRLMTIENLLATPKKSRASPKVKVKEKTKFRGKSGEGKSDSWEDDESSVVDDFKLRKPRVNNATFRVRSHLRKGLREVFSSPSQVQVPSVPEKERVKVKSPKLKESLQCDKKSVEDVFGTLIVKQNFVPSPCNACGRSERPERLHAHPSMPQHKRSKLKDDQYNSVVVQQKNSVMKPVAMKFRSGKTLVEKHPVEKLSLEKPVQEKETKEKKSVPLIRRETFKIEKGSKPHLSVEKTSPLSPSPTRKTATHVHSTLIPRRQGLPRTPDKTPRASLVSPAVPLLIPVPTNPPVVHSASPRRPRTITCYLCQKQFGTASYPLHEPQCLQKWHRENQALPASQQQAEPLRPPPGDALNYDHAWEAAQAAMVTCDGCSKTFLPHRLDAHQRVCPHYNPFKKSTPSIPKQLQTGWESDKDDRSERSVLLEGPTSIHCHICGRVFNKAAIEKHEQQCLKRWQQEHSRESGSSAPPSNSSTPPISAQSTPRRRLVLCYLCGRQFGSTSIAIHEPQCLRKWQQENDRLPAAQRRAEPQKPDVVYDTDTGRVDHHATQEAQWQCHLVQLVPCGKCGRTFNPERVIVHEKCCKGPQKQ